MKSSTPLPPLPPTMNKLPAEFFEKNDLEVIKTPEQMDAILQEMVAKTLPLLADRNPTKPLYFVGVMQGGINSGVRFRQLFPLPLTDAYAHVTSYKYAETPGPLEWLHRPNVDMTGCHVIVYDDVKDSGESLREVIAYCKAKGAAKVVSVTLTDKTFKHPNDDISHHVYGIDIGDVYLGADGLDFVVGEKPNQFKVFRNMPGMFGKRPKAIQPEESKSNLQRSELVPNTLLSAEQIAHYVFTPSIMPYVGSLAQTHYANAEQLQPYVSFADLNQKYLTTAIKITMDYQDSPKPPIAMYLVDQSIDFAMPLINMLNLPLEQDYVEFVRDDKEENTPHFTFVQKPHINVTDRSVLLIDRFCGNGYRLTALVAELSAMGADVRTVVLGDKAFKRLDGPNKNFKPDYCVQEINEDVELAANTRDKHSAKNLLGPAIFKRVTAKATSTAPTQENSQQCKM